MILNPKQVNFLLENINKFPFSSHKVYINSIILDGKYGEFDQFKLNEYITAYKLRYKK